MEKTNVEHNASYCWGTRLVAMVTTSDLKCVCVCREDTLRGMLRWLKRLRLQFPFLNM